MRVALIPARGGSKRIPRKNIRFFKDQPIIAYSIQAAQKTGLFDAIWVSTDDEEIARVAADFGAQTPFMRPFELANDLVGTMPVVRHALDWGLSQGYAISHMCCIYATAPLVAVADICGAFDLLVQGSAAHCFPLVHFPAPIQRALKLTADGRVAMFDEAMREVRSQDLEPAFHDAGQFYWSTRAALLDDVPVFSPQTIGLNIPAWRVCDIDTEEDWTRAELIYDALLDNAGMF